MTKKVLSNEKGVRGSRSSKGVEFFACSAKKKEEFNLFMCSAQKKGDLCEMEMEAESVQESSSSYCMFL
ncbi:MAG: hypothetical protein AAB359_04010 [Elusimicrobiota bacterium]